jgi:hypothetical protein
VAAAHRAVKKANGLASGDGYRTDFHRNIHAVPPAGGSN